MISPLLFRRAEVGDAARLSEIALAGKRHWGYPEAWIELWRHDLAVTPEYLRTQPVSVAEIGGETVGFVGLSTGAGGRYLEHLWLRPEHIGRGLGRRLFDEGVRLARAEGAAELRIKSDPNAESFYLKMGAVRTGVEEYLLPGNARRVVPLLVFGL